MRVTGFALARISGKEHFLESNYYIGGLDLVPYASPKGIKNGNVHYLPTNGNPITDHLYDNKQFDKVRQNLSDDYKISMR